MATKQSDHGVTAQKVISGVILLSVVILGVLALLFFWSKIMMPGDLAAYSLPLVAAIAGAAATFNPCGLPALPGFLTFLGGSSGTVGVRRRLGLSLLASLGAMSVVLILGVVVALAGAGTKDLIAPNFRWVQLAVGVLLISVATLHLTGYTARLPLVGRVMALGSRMWEGAIGRPSPRSSYLFGGGFVLVGVG